MAAWRCFDIRFGQGHNAMTTGSPATFGPAWTRSAYDVFATPKPPCHAFNLEVLATPDGAPDGAIIGHSRRLVTPACAMYTMDTDGWTTIRQEIRLSVLLGRLARPSLSSESFQFVCLSSHLWAAPRALPLRLQDRLMP